MLDFISHHVGPKEPPTQGDFDAAVSNGDVEEPVDQIDIKHPLVK